MIRRLLTLVVLTAALAGAALATGIAPAAADSPSISRKDAIREGARGARLDRPHARAHQGWTVRAGVRGSQGRLPQPLRARRDPAPGRRPDADGRGGVAVRRDPHDDRRNDDAERARSATRSSSCAASSTTSSASLTSTGLAGAAASCSASRSSSSSARASRSCCCCRVLLGYLEAAKARPVPAPDADGGGDGGARHRRHRHRCCSTVFAALPVGREMLEAITALLAVARAVLRLVLADRPARAQAVDGVPEVAGVERGGRRLDRLAGARRVHRRVPRGLRDRALLPSRCCRSATGLGLWVARRPDRSAWSALGRRVGHDLPPRTAAAHPDVPVHRRRVMIMAHVGRVPRQRGARAAGGRRVIAHHRLPCVARPADLPVRRRPATGRPGDGHRPGIVLTGIYVMGGIYMFLVKPRLAQAQPPQLARCAADRRSAVRAALDRRSASASTSEERSRRPSRSTSSAGESSAEPCVPTTHDDAEGVAAGRGAVRRRRRRGGRRRAGRPRHALDDAGRQRAARGRRRHGRHDRHGPASRARARPASAPS